MDVVGENTNTRDLGLKVIFPLITDIVGDGVYIESCGVIKHNLLYCIFQCICKPPLLTDNNYNRISVKLL